MTGDGQTGKVLVVLPTLGDRPHTLEIALASVDSQRASVELTIALVAPPEARLAKKLADRFDARFIPDRGEGISAAINVAVSSATDEQYYAWLGDDDLYRPNGLLTLRTLIESAPDNVVAYGACDYIDEQGRIIATNAAGHLARRILSWGPNLIPHPATLIRLDAMGAVGKFDPELRYAMDLDMFLRLRSYGNFASTRTPVAGFRWHADSLTVANRSASGNEAAAIRKRYLPRPLRSVAWLWEVPMSFAAERASRRLWHRAEALRESAT